MLILAIESTCDETAAAVVRDGRHVLSSVVATQDHLHSVYRGVVPEIASRAHIENILPVVDQAVSKSNVSLNDIDAIAVAREPGLIGSLLVGVTAAKALAWSLAKPLVGVDHVRAHLYSVLLDQDNTVEFPAVGLVASGGHTALYLVNHWHDITRIGGTIDDAVGECYDKVSALLGLGWPGGPIIDRLAQAGNPRAIDFPKSLLSRDSLDFSFSGLKTAVRYHLFGTGASTIDTSTKRSDSEIVDVCASFQRVCVEVIVEKIRRACVKFNAKSILLGGGVSANSGVRQHVNAIGLPVHLPHLRYCTDNAAMIGGLGHYLFEQGRRDELSMDASPLRETQRA
jgi:N6-L-threonylcarbamoyladenine synthase